MKYVINNKNKYFIYKYIIFIYILSKIPLFEVIVFKFYEILKKIKY